MLSYKFSQTQVIITLDNLWLREEQMNMSKFYEVSKVLDKPTDAHGRGYEQHERHTVFLYV